jgi:hypothetical protein
LYAESVGKFQPRVALWQPWDTRRKIDYRNPEGVATVGCINSNEPSTQTLSGLRRLICRSLIPGLPKRNPGLEFANTFGVQNEN